MKKKLLFIFFVSLVIKIFADDFDDKFTNQKWILEYYNKIVFMHNRDLLLDYIPKYRNQKEVLFQRETLLDGCDYWNDDLSFTSVIYLLFDSFEVNNIKQIEKNYFEISIVSGIIDNERYIKNLENGCDWKQSNIEIKTLFFKFDGDYLYIFLNKKDNLLTTYCAYENSEYNSLVKFIQTNTSDISNISLPRHADGSCDYETAVTVQQGKRYRASDNLRLRSSGSTAGKPVVTIGKGTQVKVLAVGAEQRIDGITSNWVQVEVQSGAKDRDGKPIAAGTTGWCFGGYLAER